jgi:hypothetical protein
MNYQLYNESGDFKIYNGDEWKKEHLPLRPIAYYIYPEMKFKDYRYFDDFTYHGETYNLNSVVRLSKEAKKFLGSDFECTQIVQHEITNENKERWGYVVRRSSEKIWHVFTTVSPEQLIEEIVTPAGPRKENNKVEYFKDGEVKGVPQMWVYYILAMIVATLFNDRIMMWYIFSIIFFVWRDCKLKKPKQHNYDV